VSRLLAKCLNVASDLGSSEAQLKVRHSRHCSACISVNSGSTKKSTWTWGQEKKAAGVFQRVTFISDLPVHDASSIVRFIHE
jgi:hypothetical protein